MRESNIDVVDIWPIQPCIIIESGKFSTAVNDGLCNQQCGLIVALCNRQNVMLVSECEFASACIQREAQFWGQEKLKYLNLRRTKDQAVSKCLLFIVRMDGWMHHCVFRMNCLFTYCVWNEWIQKIKTDHVQIRIRHYIHNALALVSRSHALLSNVCVAI